MDWEKFLYDNSLAIATCLITIGGLWLNNHNLKKTFKNDFGKMHQERFLDEMCGLSHSVVDVMQQIIDANNDQEKLKQSIESLKDVENKVLAHGSSIAVEICCYAQQNVFAGGSPTKTLAALSLLICQLRYDLSGEVLSYESWFKMKISDYTSSKMCEEIERSAREIVNLYNLNQCFLKKISVNFGSK